MAIKTRSPYLSCTKVLAIFALFVYLATSVVYVYSMAKGVSRRSDAVTSLESVSVKRYLKTSAAMTANDPSEERAGFAGLCEFGNTLNPDSVDPAPL
ncbi:unnamed protein product [Peronospora belbahrii]|uniref:Uncharacterized protein n=1 Tax=Peronospora belbahrii TaxID=622444 RepID=A0AAU9L4W2_9STRA|nr:unnamed protein product [Peronospora belbahrii]